MSITHQSGAEVKIRQARVAPTTQYGLRGVSRSGRLNIIPIRRRVGTAWGKFGTHMPESEPCRNTGSR